MDRTDFPAAHSMDTTWFALDRCGHVGVFHSGEEGAVPKRTPHVEDPFDAETPRTGELAWALENGILRPDRHETAVTVHEEQRGPEGGIRSRGAVHSAYGFFLRGPGAPREAVLARNATGRQSVSPGYYDLEFGATDGRAWFRGWVTSLAWNWLHAGTDHCFGCLQGGPVGLEERCRIYRLFTFHCTEYGYPPYRREENPPDAVLLEELNRRFEGRLPGGIPRFEQFCFAEKPVLQPIQWLPSLSYDYDDWVREDGQAIHREGPEGFPAAHSMDTDWFAVDRDGHVAVFESGDSGAVPTSAGRGQQMRFDWADKLDGVLHPTPTIFDALGYAVRMPDGSIEHPSMITHVAEVSMALLFLRSDERMRGEIEAGRASHRLSTEGVALWCRRAVPWNLVEAVHQAGECIVCGNWWESREDKNYHDVVDFGFFGYEHQSENWISGPYGRQRIPQQPIYADDLPAGLREIAERVRFGDLCFAREAHLQPVLHLPCDSHQSAWLDFDGRTVRPIPGKEEEYPDAYEIYARNADLTVIPPASPGPREPEPPVPAGP